MKENKINTQKEVSNEIIIYTSYSIDLIFLAFVL